MLSAAFSASTPATVAPAHAGYHIDSVEVIDALNVDDLPRGGLYRFWFRVTDNPIGQAWYVPVIVVRGATRIGALALAGDLAGVERWRAIAGRLDKLTTRA